MGQVIMNGKRWLHSWHTFGGLQIFSVPAKKGSNPFKHSTPVYLLQFLLTFDMVSWIIICYMNVNFISNHEFLNPFIATHLK